HIDVAQELLRRGFRRIIFKGISALPLAGTENVGLLHNTYDEILGGAELAEDLVLPEFSPDIFALKDALSIERSSKGGTEDHTMWMPVELLANYRDDSAYSDHNMGAFFPLVDL